MDTTIDIKNITPIEPQIAAGTIGAVSPIKVPQAPEPTNLLAGLTSTMQATADQSTQKEQTAQTDFTSLLQQLEGKASEQAMLEQQQGIPVLDKELLELQKIAQKQTAEYLAGFTQQEAKRQTRQETTVAQQNLTRQNAVDALLTNSLISAKQGDITFANSLVDRAINAKYEPIKQRIETQKEILRQIENKASEDRQKTLNLQLKRIEKEEENEKAKNNLIIEAAPFAPANLIAQAQQAKTPLEAAQILGKYGGDYLGNKLKQVQIEKNYAEIQKINDEIKRANIDINTTMLPNTSTGTAQKLMASAKNDKQLDATERQQLSKARTVLNQLDALENNISKQNKTGLIKGRVGNLKESFGLDKDVGVINAQLQAITPNLARGVYGEVGVLTDNDIRLYRTTLPRLDRPEDQNDAVLALTMKTVQKSIENTLTGAANSGIDVSGWTQDYLAITSQINEIEDRIGVSREYLKEAVAENPEIKDEVSKMLAEGIAPGTILDGLKMR